MFPIKSALNRHLVNVHNSSEKSNGSFEDTEVLIESFEENEKSIESFGDNFLALDMHVDEN